MAPDLGSAIAGVIEGNAQQIAVIQHGGSGSSRTVSYGELGGIAGNIAALLGKAVRPHHTVGIFLRRSVEHVATVVGALRSQTPYFSINPAATAHQVCGMIALAKADVLVVDNAALLRLTRLTAEDLGGCRILYLPEGPFSSAHAAALEKLNLVAQVDPLPESAAGEGDSEGIHERPSSVGCFLFTSGSTGTPRGVMIDRSDLAERVSSEMGAYNISAADRLLNVLPFSFDVGCNQLLTVLVSGATLVILNSWLPSDILASIDAHEVTGMSAVPAIWESLFDHEESEVRQGLGPLRYITISGGSLDAAGLAQLRSLGPDLAIYKTYGQTETFRSGMLMPDEYDVQSGSVGRPPPGVRVSIIDSEGRPVASNEIGEIVHEGVGTMVGYLANPEATNQKVVQVEDPDGTKRRMVLTGDRGHIDEDGYLFIRGRMDRMLKIRGNRVYPEEIEVHLRQHPQVAEAVVVMLAGEDGGLVAGIVTTDGKIPQRELKSFVARRVLPFMLPGRFVHCDAFPRTSTGKVDLKAVATMIEGCDGTSV